jgi:metal-responsive CopG/Arc/MetJ family transcriptional regulator
MILQRLSYLITDVSLGIIQMVNRHKDRCLSQRLFKIAEKYNTRPGTHNYTELT